jgi:hypothetical protein
MAGRKKSKVESTLLQVRDSLSLSLQARPSMKTIEIVG